MKTTKDMILIMRAFDSGMSIQYKLNATKAWVDAPKPCWNWYQFDFRIKRDYTMQQEVAILRAEYMYQ